MTSDSNRQHRSRRALAVPRPAAMIAVLALVIATTGLTVAPASADHPGKVAAVQRLSGHPAVLAARAAAAPVGKLTPSDCAAVPGTAACDLYAMAGSAPILGSPVPIWGFSKTGVAGSATAPGPMLVVRQGDQVSITLHNQLAGQVVSLAFPGQTGVAFGSGPGDDQSGVGTGTARTYTFSATRAGTFLYEAGHTANGARQVAMGLAGALIVLPADGSAYGAAAAGFPATSYNDDGVLVLSEIDPALNANPNTFDMRDFAPKFRLFNGKPYPTSDPIATDQDHTVLLRYVNVGSQSHAMSVLGGDQVEIAQDGHQLKFQSTVTAETVDPGATLDTLVKMPTGPEAKLAVYEPAMHLDNAGQHAADPLQFAFGGMLTFLDTNAPPPSTDGVGPVSTHVSLSPNPSDARSAVTVTADLSDASTGHSAVSQAEFVVDDIVSTGAGFGVAMTAPSTSPFGTEQVSGATGTIPATAADCTPATGIPPVALNCLAAGKHTVFIRALDAAGNWGVVGSAILNLPKTGPQTTGGTVDSSPANGSADLAFSATGDDSAAGGTITAAEYFLDAVGADGTGAAVTRNRTATVVSEDVSLLAATVQGLTEGTHHLFLHSKDSLNLWGPTLDIPFVVDLTGPGVDSASVGPNPSNGILTDKANPGYLVISAQITDNDAGGALQSPVVDAEAFLDPKVANPAGGTGLQLVAVDGSMDSSQEALYGLIPISQIRPLAAGTHHVLVRGQDAAGNWGPLFAVNLIVDKTAPVLGAPIATPNPTNGAAILTLSAPVTEAVGVGTAEFWLGATDPGVGKGTRVTVGVTGGIAAATIPLTGIAAGAQSFNLRVQDTAGNWSNAVSTTVTVMRPNLIFSGLFEGTTPGWSSSAGTVSTSAAAKLPSAGEPTSTQGLAVAIPSSAPGRVSTVTDTTPSAETTYHAKFTFNRNTLTSGTRAANLLTLFEARTATAQAFAVQFRMNRGTAQVRVTLARSIGTATGGWVSLPAGKHVLQVDWAAATAGSLVLRIDGTAVSTLTGNTNTLRVETAVLGVTAGVATGAGRPTGTAYFDTFLSARHSL